MLWAACTEQKQIAQSSLSRQSGVKMTAWSSSKDSPSVWRLLNSHCSFINQRTLCIMTYSFPLLLFSFFYFSLFLKIFRAASYFIALAGLDFVRLLALASQCWDSRYVPPCQTLL